MHGGGERLVMVLVTSSGSRPGRHGKAAAVLEFLEKRPALGQHSHAAFEGLYRLDRQEGKPTVEQGITGREIEVVVVEDQRLYSWGQVLIHAWRRRAAGNGPGDVVRKSPRSAWQGRGYSWGQVLIHAWRRRAAGNGPGDVVRKSPRSAWQGGGCS